MRLILAALWAVHGSERGEVSWKWLGLGIVVGAVLVILLAALGLIKFLIPGE